MFKAPYLLATATLLLTSSLSVSFAADKQFNIKPVIKQIEVVKPPLQLLNAFKPVDVNTQMLELHGLGKTKDVNTATLELHGLKPGPREVNTAALELHGQAGVGKPSGKAKEVNTATLELHGLSQATKTVNVPGTLELHGRIHSKEVNTASKRIGMTAPPSMQGAAVQNNSRFATNTLPNNQPIDPKVIKKNSTPDNKAVANQPLVIGTKSATITDNRLPDIKPIILAPVIIQNSPPAPFSPVAAPVIVTIMPLPSILTPPSNTFDKVGYKRDANLKLGNLWLNKCSGIDCKRDIQKLIYIRVAEVLDKAIDLRNPVLLNNLETQMDAKYNPQMQQVLDKEKPTIRIMPKPIKINPSNLRL